MKSAPKYGYIASKDESSFDSEKVFAELEDFVNSCDGYHWEVEDINVGPPIIRSGILEESSYRFYYIARKPQFLALHLNNSKPILELCREFATTFGYQVGEGILDKPAGYDENFFIAK